MELAVGPLLTLSDLLYELYYKGLTLSCMGPPVTCALTQLLLFLPRTGDVVKCVCVYTLSTVLPLWVFVFRFEKQVKASTGLHLAEKIENKEKLCVNLSSFSPANTHWVLSRLSST